LILDTNALSAFIDGDATVGRMLQAEARACIPVIALGEFRYGILQSRHRAEYEEWLRAHLGQFEVLDIGEATTNAYAEVRAALKKQGTPIPANDAWIAALAWQHRLPILSRDQHFDLVPQVTRREW